MVIFIYFVYCALVSPIWSLQPSQMKGDRWMMWEEAGGSFVQVSEAFQILFGPFIVSPAPGELDIAIAMKIS